MIREICMDEAFLARKAEPATADDLDVGEDLLETLKAHNRSYSGVILPLLMLSSSCV